MMRRPRAAAPILVLLALGSTLTAAGPAAAADLASTDVRAQLPAEPTVAPAEPAAQSPAQGSTPAVARAQQSERFGVPTVLWPVRGSLDATLGVGLRGAGSDLEADAIEASRLYLGAYAPLYGLTPLDVARARVSGVHAPETGGLAVLFEQRVGGVEVYDQRMAVVLDRDLELVALTGFLSPLARAELADEPAFEETPASAAIAAAYRDRFGADVVSGDVAPTGSGGYGYADYALDPGHPLLGAELERAEDVRVKPVYVALQDDLEPAWYLELVDTLADGRLDAWGYVVSARDERILVRRELVVDASYTVQADATSGRPLPHPIAGVFPHPTGRLGWTPPGGHLTVAPIVALSVPNGLFGVDEPWLPSGTDLTLNGNNAFTYLDISGDDGFDAEDLTLGSGPDDAFEATYALSTDPVTDDGRSFALVQSFYVVNYLHDLFYAVGFDEAARNAQADNYGREGVPGDALRIELQDASGLNNANMFTPADGASPRMQTFLFPSSRQHVSVDGGAPGTFEAASATFAPIVEVSGDLMLVDGEGFLGLGDGCGGIGVDLTGDIAVLELTYACAPSDAMYWAQNAGAIGVIFLYSGELPAGAVPALYCGNCPTGLSDLAIPGVAVGGDMYGPFVDALNAGGSFATIDAASPARDSAVDNTVVAHEWGHYLFGRLLGNPTNNQGASLNEGMADFVALLALAGPDDPVDPVTGELSGVYPVGQWAVHESLDDLYFGIRRAPYSPDFSVNPFTFQHIGNLAPAPEGAPLRFYDPNTNAEAHASGEIFAESLWTGFSRMVGEYGFAEAQGRMLAITVLALRIAPREPTYTELRDAFLAAARASSGVDAELLWAGFAERGLGRDARSPDRFSTDHFGVVESFEAGPAYAITGLSITESPTVTCDADGVWDVGERATIAVDLLNVGGADAASTRVRVRGIDPGVTFPDGDTVDVGLLEPDEAAHVELSGLLQASASGESRVLEVEVSGDDATGAPPVTSAFDVRTELDVALEGGRDDDFEGPPVWELQVDPTLSRNDPWRIVRDATGNHYAHVPDPATENDVALVSPPLEMASGDDFIVSFRHRFDLSAHPVALLDGGVIELSRDDGATWEDVADYVEPGYTGTIATAEQVGVGPESASHLAGRPAYGGTSTNYPSFEDAVLDFGTQLGGETVRLRFRAVADTFWDGGGWDVDDVAFEGLDNAPFPVWTPEDGLCLDTPPVAFASTDAAVAEPSDRVTLLSVGSLDLLDDPLSYAWTQTAGPTVTLTDASAAAAAFDAPTVDVLTVLTFELVVTAGGRESTPDTVDVWVLPARGETNGTPVADAGPDQTADEGDEVQLDGSASTDPDGDLLAFTWVQVAGPGVLLDDPRDERPSFTAPDVEAATVVRFELTVDDGGAVSEPESVEVTVQAIVVPPENHAPSADAGPDQTVLEAQAVGLDGSYSADPDGDALTYEWTQVAGPTVTLDGAAGAAPTFTAPALTPEGDPPAETPDPVALAFELVVDDGELASEPSRVEVTLMPIPVRVVTETNTGNGDSGGCSQSGAPVPPSWALLALLGAVVRGGRRRR